MPYKLSATLAAHTSDVRAVVAPTDGLVLSASRDATAITWTRPDASAPFVQAAVLRTSPRYVNAIAYIPPSPDAPEGYAVTSGQDAIINIFSLANVGEDPNFTLIGHNENVCTLHVAPNGTIISGSWDHTARVWTNFQPTHELVGHTGSVLAVIAFDSDQFLTGSADNSVKLWQKHKAVHTYKGHTQAVRGLTLIPDIGFASCSNDSEIRVWTLGGDAIYSLSGHTAFVYSLALLPSGDLVSTGEDRSLRIWHDGECVQTIVHPAISVWTVATMPNGDIVTGTSDGKVRIFSAVEERWAPAQELQAYDAELAATAVPAEQVGDVKKDELPGEEALLQPGKKAGDVKMIRRGDRVEAHQWDSASMSWQKIGDVVDAVGSSRKQLYEGKEYDYVFDVDVQDGVPPLKLPYNATENPYNAAQRFLQNNELPLSYLDEVVKFIEKSTAGVNIGTGGDQFVDPFTGASRYQATQNTSTNSNAEYMDPFTGASRYRAPPSTAPPPVASNDPWTGASRYSGTSAPAPAPQPTPSGPMITIPVRATLSFRQANVDAMQNKLFQFDQDLTQEISTATLAMYPDERSDIEEAFLYLQQAVANASPNTAPPVRQETVEAIMSLIERWPSGSRFPLIDLCRLVIGYCSGAYSEPAFRQKFFRRLFQTAEWTESWGSPLPRSRDTNILLLMRGLANAFQDDTQLGDALWAKEILRRLDEAPYTALSKAQRVALGTLLFNLSCVGLRQRLDPELRALHVKLILQSLHSEAKEADGKGEKSDSEAAYRSLVALGNTVHAAAQNSNPLDPEQAKAAKEIAAGLLSHFTEPRIQSVSRAILSLL